MATYKFAFDGTPEAREVTCPDCGQKHDGVTGHVLNGGTAFAVYFADWAPAAQSGRVAKQRGGGSVGEYPHDNEAWVEVILGSFDAPDYKDDVTIGCRYGYVDGQADVAASLFTPTRTGAIFGDILDRAQALKSARIADFWALTDWLVVNDQLLNRTVYRMPPKT